MHSAFNLLFFLILCSHRYLRMTGLCALEKYHLKIAIIFITQVLLYRFLIIFCINDITQYIMFLYALFSDDTNNFYGNDDLNNLNFNCKLNSPH